MALRSRRKLNQNKILTSAIIIITPNLQQILANRMEMIRIYRYVACLQPSNISPGIHPCGEAHVSLQWNRSIVMNPPFGILTTLPQTSPPLHPRNRKEVMLSPTLFHSTIPSRYRQPSCFFPSLITYPQFASADLWLKHQTRRNFTGLDGWLAEGDVGKSSPRGQGLTTSTESFLQLH